MYICIYIYKNIYIRMRKPVILSPVLSVNSPVKLKTLFIPNERKYTKNQIYEFLQKKRKKKKERQNPFSWFNTNSYRTVILMII